MPEKVAIMGSGNWGSAIARIVGQNAAKHPDFEEVVNMWVYEEEVNGRKLTDIINTEHENVKYLPNVKLPENVVAVPDAVEAAKGATLLIFVLPHQFLPRLCGSLKGNVPDNCRAISLIKGIDFDENGVVLMSKVIEKHLGVECSALMGANVANEVAQDFFCETTVGATNLADGAIWRKLFHTPKFHVSVVEDVAGVELCGALKNIVAVGAGFIDGLGYGGNTKAAIMRIGLTEMKLFSYKFAEGVKEHTFLESCGVADLITTCFGGRNRKCAEAFVKEKKSWEQLEDELLGGQKLQGTLTAKDVYDVLKKNNCIEQFPLFVKVYQIAFEGIPATAITDFDHDYEADEPEK